MPILKFLLTNPELRLHTEKDSERWALWFDAKIERNNERFTIFCGLEQYDGFSMNGTAIVEQRTSKTEAQQSPLSEPNDRKFTEERPGYISIAYPPRDWKGSEKFPPFFEIKISLPADTFLCVLRTNPETRLIHLWVDTSTIIQEDGLVYGNDPTGNEIEWRVEKKNYAHAKSITLKINPCPDDALGAEPSPEVKQQELPVPTPVLVNTSDLASAINRLFWAVVLIGLLLILKAYW